MNRYPQLFLTVVSSRRAVLFAWALLASACVCAQQGQQEGQDGGGAAASPAAAATATGPDAGLSLKSVEGQIADLEGKGEQEGANADRALALLKDAQQDLLKRDASRRRIDDCRDLLETGPAKIADIQKTLSSPLPEINLEEGARNWSLDRIETRVNAERAELANTAEQRRRLDGDLELHQNRTARNRQRLQVLREQLKQLDGQSDEQTEDPDALLAAAKRTRQRALEEAVRAEIEALQQEEATHELRLALLTAQRDLALRNETRQKAVLEKWQDLALQKRRKQARETALETQKAHRTAQEQNLPKPVADILEQNVEYARSLEETQGRLDDLNEDARDKKDNLEALREDARVIRQRMEASGLTQANSILLRQVQETIPNPRTLRGESERRARSMADRKATQIELDQRRRKLVAKTDDLVDEALAALDPDTSAQQRQTLEARCRKLLGDQLDLVGKLYQTYGEEILILGNIDDTLQGMIREAGSLDEFIQSWLLWARSVPPITWRDGGAFWKGLKWFLSPANWLGLAQDTLRSLLRRPLAALLLAALAAGAFLLAGRAGQESDELRQGARSSRSSLGNASLAVACDVVSALPWPVFFVGIGFLLRLNVEARPFTQCVASALISVSVFSGSANAIRHLCRRDGATRIYFGWSRTVTDTIDGLLTTLLAFVVPLRFLITVTDESRTLVLEQGLGRPAFLLYCAVLGWLLVRALRRSGPLYKAARSTHPDRLSVRWWRGWQAVLVAIPVGLALFAVAGYYYGTLLLDRRIICTAWLCTAVYILNWLGRYWLAGEKQRLENEEEARQEKDEQQERAEQSQESPDTIDVDVEENRLGIEQISEHSRALLTTLTLAVLVAGLYLVWRDLLPALTVFEQKTLWHYSVPGPSGSDVLGSVTVGSVLLAILFGAIAYAAARNIPGVLEMTVLSRLPLDEGVRFALSTVSRYAIITAGILIVAGKLGLQWGKLQWLVAALGVGLGFGLQEIVANFISGLIILFERPFRLGDTVTVGDVSGKVTRIQIRATTIVDWERRELIVPNRDFITGRLINWSLSDPITRLTIPVGIAYGADTEKAEKLLIQVAEKHPDVLDQPEPSALFLGFGDNSLNFELRVFVNGIEKRFRTIHSLHMEIDRVFRKEDIVIAFPQRDTHLDTLRPLDIRLVNHDADDQKKNDGDGKEKDDGKREDHEPQKEATEQEPGGTNNG